MKPPTPRMVEFLMECHERELMNLPLCNATAKYAANLIKRKMLAPKAYLSLEGKKIIFVHTTQLGRDFLSSLE
jgi:hypothetical protein